MFVSIKKIGNADRDKHFDQLHYHKRFKIEITNS